MAKAELRMKGILSLDFLYQGLEVWLVFSSGSPEDREYTLADVKALADEHKVSAPWKSDELGQALQARLDRKEKSFRHLLARGQAPVHPQAEDGQISAGELPAAWQEAARVVLQEAQGPQVFKEVVVRVEREVMVQKKATLPFLQGKEEAQRVVDKEVRREPVWVDPVPTRLGWAAAGEKIGVIYPSKPGQNGKGVRGEILPFTPVDDPSFYVGSHVIRKSGDLTAEVDGLVRVGKNWVDLVPFSDHQMTLGVSDDKATLFLSLVPGCPLLAPPAWDVFLQKALALGFTPDKLVDEAEYRQVLAECLDTGKPLENRPMTPPEDAYFDITVSTDRMKAVLSMAKGSGHGKPLVLKEVGKALNESGIKLNDREKVKADILAFVQSSERTLIGYVLAEGRLPETPPRQAISLSIDELAKKERDVVEGRIKAADPPPCSPEFPLARLRTLGFVKKDQRLATLGTVITTTPGVDVFGQVVPGIASEALKVHLSGALEQSQLFINAKADGLLLYAEDDGFVWFAHIPYADAEFSLELGPGAMTALLTVDAHLGAGIPLAKAAVEARIKELGIKGGLMTDVLDAALAKAVEGQSFRDLVIARGKEAQEGASARVEWLVQFATGQAVRLRQDGTADFRNQDRITRVAKDTPLARILPPEYQPAPGHDVLGKEIQAPALGSLEFQVGAHIRQEVQEDGATLLVADTDGELRREKGVLSVSAAYTIKGNVDAKTGNIKFPGAVQVSGDVMSGFTIIAGGDIRVAGSVEASLLSSDTDIVIQAGVKGGGKALLRSRQSVMAGFIEMATVMAVGDIRVKKSILRSRVKCNGQVILPEEGQVIGGEIQVKTGLVTGRLGSENLVPTRVVFGQDILVADQIETEEKEIRKLQEEILVVNAAMQSPEKISQKESLQDLFNTKVKLIKLLEKRNLRLFGLRERHELHCPSEVIVRGTVFPGVVFECHGRTHEIHKPVQKVRFWFDTGSSRIQEESLDKKEASPAAIAKVPPGTKSGPAPTVAPVVVAKAAPATTPKK